MPNFGHNTRSLTGPIRFTVQVQRRPYYTHKVSLGQMEFSPHQGASLQETVPTIPVCLESPEHITEWDVRLLDIVGDPGEGMD